MKRELVIAPGLSLPLEVVTQTICILAKRRVGKSYTMRRVAEQLFDAGQQIVIVDPKGDQWGIRYAADGKAPGRPVIILGGERGDAPLEPGGGEIVAKLVVEERVSVLLDLSLFRKYEVAQFMTGFLEELYRLKAREIYRTPLMLVVDEADAIAPQNPQKGEERMLGAAEDIVRRGGQRGIGCMLVTQRSAVLNKNVLTQAQILVALRTIAPQDLKAMDAWIQVHGEPEERKTLMESLPSLPVGDAWFWSPGWPTNEGIFKRVHVLPIETFDSGATPKPGEKRVEPKQPADVDLEALKRQMAETIEKARESDPALLKRTIAELRKENHHLKAAAPGAAAKEVKIERVEVPILSPADLKRFETASARIDVACQKIADVLGAVREQQVLLREKVVAATKSPAPGPVRILPRHVPPARYQMTAADIAAARAPQPQPAAGAPNGELTEGERRVLTAAAQYGEGVTREQISVLTSYKRSTRDKYLQLLAQKGYVTPGGAELVATDAGRAALGDFEELPTGQALVDYWMQRLPEGERRIFEIVVAAYPNGVRRDELDGPTGFKRSTRDKYLQHSIARRILEPAGAGEVRAAATFFE
jgi:hypothetical protein